MKLSPTLARWAAISLGSLALVTAAVRAAEPTPASLDADTRKLLAEVQQAGIKYFYDFGHPVSGLTRVGTERVPELCEIGGTGWGLYNLIVAADRGFVPRADVAKRLQTMLRFLSKADRFHGAFPHWMNGETGKTIPFNKEDDGADLVETAFLCQGLIAVREYFTHSDAVETEVRQLADQLWRDVDWTWFATEKDGRAYLRWHWSPTLGFKKDMPIQGFNETHIVYILALASPTHPVSMKYYRQGWEGGGAHLSKARSDFGIPLTLGRGSDMPMFFAHYSYMGFDPHAISWEGRSYFDQIRDMCRVQVAYAQSMSEKYKGYGPLWGLTACKGVKGYKAFCPGTRDEGTIAPTAALSSLPYVPEASLSCLKELQTHYRDKLWGTYGFADSFNLTQDWVVVGYLGNDVGTIAPMIENYLSGLCWKSFMHAPEIIGAVKQINASGTSSVAAH